MSAPVNDRESAVRLFAFHPTNAAVAQNQMLTSEHALRFCCGLLLLEDFATMVAAVILRGFEPAPHGILACLVCVHACRGALLTCKLGVGFDIGLVEHALRLTWLGLGAVLALTMCSSVSVPELLVLVLAASAVSFLGNMMVLAHRSASPEDDLEALATSATFEAHQSQLQRLQRLTMSVAGVENVTGIEQQMCLICLGDLQQEEMLLQLQCKHLHHVKCIQSWFLHGGDCPSRCRKNGSKVEDPHSDIEDADADMESI